MTTIRVHALVASLALTAAACGNDNNNNNTPDAPNPADAMVPQPDAPPTDTDTLLKTKVKTVVVIYAENWSFDSLFGTFPGANGIPGKNPTASGNYVAQIDRDVAGTALATLPPTWGGVTASGFTPAITQDMSTGHTNVPFSMETTYTGWDKTYISRDLWHRFFQNQMQIDGGKNDKFAAFADSGGLVMGYVDGSKTKLWGIAQQYTLLDNFFMGAFGGSFLNHQYLICQCAPEWPNADADPNGAKPVIAQVDLDGSGHMTSNLTIDTTPTTGSPASSMDGPPKFIADGAVSPKDYFHDGTFRGINTLQPPYQPSANAPAATDSTHLFADPSKANTIPPQTAATVGDQLDAKGVTWAWYSGAWNLTLQNAVNQHSFPFGPPGGAPNFQFHHQPFNYYAKFDPMLHPDARAKHLKDFADLDWAIQQGTLPQVVFYKPEGDLNEHPGYASVDAGDAHIAQVIQELEASPQFANMVIIVTYDENGGWWDHVAPPKGDLLGPGTRIPAIVISPYAKKGTVDHTQYDTASIVRFINRRFGLDALPGLTARDNALVSNGGSKMGDLTNALDLTK